MDTCRKGHQDWIKNGKGQKVCRICRSDWAKEYNQRLEKKEYDKQYRKEHVEQFREYDRKRSQDPKRQKYVRELRLRTKFNVTAEWHESQLLAQGNKCPICNCEFTYGKGPQGMSVDHDHNCCPDKTSCGECVRGIICISCNKALGFFRDDISNIHAALSYLTQWEEQL